MRDLHPPDSIHMRVHVIEPFAKFATMRLVRRVRTWCGDYRYEYEYEGLSSQTASHEVGQAINGLIRLIPPVSHSQ